MSAILMPRLSRLGVEEVLTTLRRNRNPVRSLNEFDANRAGVTYAETGGQRVAEARLVDFARDIIQLARNHGFPVEVTPQGRQKFDAACAIWLAEAEELHSGELLRDDVWAFISSVLLLHVTVWRFPTLTTDRFHGGERNMFQRLWYRAVTLDRGHDHEQRWELVTALTEDAIAQIIERPSLRGDRRLALAIAEGWFRMAAGAAGASMERIMRRVVRDLRMRNEVQFLSALPDCELSVLIDAQFSTALRIETHLAGETAAASRHTQSAVSRATDGVNMNAPTVLSKR